MSGARHSAQTECAIRAAGWKDGLRPQAADLGRHIRGPPVIPGSTARTISLATVGRLALLAPLTEGLGSFPDKEEFKERAWQQ